LAALANGFSALQRAEIAEILTKRAFWCIVTGSFSALQRAEIAEIRLFTRNPMPGASVSVLFNEPKLLKLGVKERQRPTFETVSVLFNEPKLLKFPLRWHL